MEPDAASIASPSGEWISIGQAALYLGVSPERARRLADNGSLGEVRFDGSMARWRMVSRRGVGAYLLNRPGPGRPSHLARRRAS